MNEKILAVDDDFTTLKIIETILKNNGFVTTCCSSPLDALKSFEVTEYDLILSDFYMPELNGDEFLKKIRSKDKYVPFVILTVNDDVKNAINLLKNGADDYINKPIVKDELIFRITKNIKEKENKKILDRIEKEKDILALESKRMVNWRHLYASKDVKQADQVINLFTRTLNQAGGFVWLDILKNSIENIDEENYKINSSLVDLIINSAEQNQIFFENITFLSNLDTMEIDFKDYTFADFFMRIFDFINSDLKYLSEKYQRKFIVQKLNQKIEGNISIDNLYFEKALKELIVNAIKYSPEKSDVIISVEKNMNLNANNGKNIDISVKNTPKRMNVKDIDGKDIVGIPYEYSELVFDLFYTIDPFPTEFEDEEWNSGTGLYIVRKIVRKHNGWCKTANGADYTKGTPEPYVKFTITIPYS